MISPQNMSPVGETGLMREGEMECVRHSIWVLQGAGPLAIIVLCTTNTFVGRCRFRCH